MHTNNTNKKSSFFSRYFARIRVVRDYSRGFTIAEVLVSIAIFAVVASVAVAVFTRVLRSQRSIVSLLNVSDNTSIAIEQMMREMRFGHGFSVSPGGTEVGFESQPPNRKNIVYRLNNDDPLRGYLERSEDSGPFARVTARNVLVKRVEFIPLQEDPDDPARITIIMVIASDKRDIAGAEVVIQTTVSQRMVNNPL